MTKLLAIDCFCGAGGLSLGLTEAGFDLAYAFDSDETAISTYRRNLGHHGHCLTAEELSGAGILQTIGRHQGEIHLVAGGPPCQGFSRQRRGDDDDSRNTGVLEFLRLVLELKPAMFLMENVAAIKGRRGQEFVALIERETGVAGYETQLSVLNAADFGVPQVRKRAFIVGWDVRRVSGFAFPEAQLIPSKYLTVRDAIADLPSPHDVDARPVPNHQRDRISDLNRERISHVPQGGGRADIPEQLQLPCHRKSVDLIGHRSVYGRLHWDRPAGTITTKCNSFTRGRFAHPAENRNISMREAARLQGFPDDFVFLGSKVPVAHQVGNAVPPPLARAIGHALAKALSGKLTSRANSGSN